MSSAWITHKFGGSSLADAAAFRQVAAIVNRPTDARQAVVVSAAAGVTDELIELAEMAANRDADYEQKGRDVHRAQAQLIEELLSEQAASSLLDFVDRDIADMGDLLRASWVMKTAKSAVEVVAGYGEVWSTRLLAALLAEEGVTTTTIDARDVLTVSPAPLAPLVDWDASSGRLNDRMSEDESSVVVITGFVASDSDGAPTTLGRNGSDYSASIFGALFGAREINIWTDVDGVLSADPGLVPEARVLSELSYNEAMELAYFGAEVIHPATMAPAIADEIPIFIRNTFNPSGPGTRIHVDSDSPLPVKGFASISEVALLNLEGTAMVGVPGISERLFGALRQAGVSVVMISQGSSEHSICFAIPQDQANIAMAAIESGFESERRIGHIQRVDVEPGCTILAVVGDRMSGPPGIAASFFGALARAGVNVKAIAQGSSERNISAVIDGADAARALRAVHTGFYLSEQTLSIGLIGPGHVGATFLDQLETRRAWLSDEYGVDLRVRAIATSKTMLVSETPIDLSEWRDRLSGDGVPTDLEALTDYVQTESVPHAVMIDCTASDDIGDRYLGWLERGIHVITPNKKGNTSSLEYYRALRDAGRSANSHYLYETTVGAALPILQALRDLVQTGDVIHRVEGILSGTLSYLFNSYDGSRPFSAIVREALEKGYTEPDPREDLSGLDVSLDDLSIDGLVPSGLEEGSVDEFLSRLTDHDDDMASLFEGARERGEVLRFVGVIDATEGCSVSLKSYPLEHAFGRIQLTDNIVQFRTRRYNENPLVVQGPGAGPDVTAGGVFADLLRLASYLGATL